MFNPFYILVNKEDIDFSFNDINNFLNLGEEEYKFIDYKNLENKNLKKIPINILKDKNKLADKLLELSGTMIKDGKQYDDPIYYYIENSYDNIIMLLIETNKLDVNKKDQDNKTLLLYYVMMGNINMVEYLLSKDANPDTQSKMNISPIGLAVESENADIVRVLVEKGANTDVRLPNSNHVLYQAQLNKDFITLEYLLKSPVDIFKNIDYSDIEINKIKYPNCFFFFVIRYCRDIKDECNRSLHLCITYKREDIERFFEENTDILKKIIDNSLIYDNVFSVFLKHNIVIE